MHFLPPPTTIAVPLGPALIDGPSHSVPLAHARARLGFPSLPYLLCSGYAGRQEISYYQKGSTLIDSSHILCKFQPQLPRKGGSSSAENS